MHAYFFFSVHEPMFHQIAARLQARGVFSEFSGFVWGKDQQSRLEGPPSYRRLIVFSEDLSPKLKSPPDVGKLQRYEDHFDININRLLHSERHLLEGRSFEARLRLVEVLFEEIETAFRDLRPDFIITEDVSCLTSYVHYLVAKDQGIPFLCLAAARLKNRVTVYSNPMQRWEVPEARFRELRERRLTEEQRQRAESWRMEQLNRQEKPVIAQALSLPIVPGRWDWSRLAMGAAARRKESGNPTVRSPIWMVQRRAERLYNQWATRSLFEEPVPGESYLIYPIHYQPEASTLVRGVYYLNQVALVEDIAKSLPVGMRLYVKEHFANRGRHTRDFYRALKRIHGVRLISPEANSWELLRHCSGVVAISSTMGWEGILLEKPVFTFGETFYNAFPLVIQLGKLPKDGWGDAIRKRLSDYEPDRELLLTYITALQESLYEGFKANPRALPQVMNPANLDLLADALEDTVVSIAGKRSAPRS